MKYYVYNAETSLLLKVCEGLQGLTEFAKQEGFSSYQEMEDSGKYAIYVQ
jgi:hypothetical protein